MYLIRFSASVLSLLVSFTQAWAHPFHISVAEVEYQPQQRSLEVALRIFPEELKTRMQQIYGPDSQLQDEQLRAYLQHRFIAVDEKNRPATLRWLGQEIDNKYIWLYFELVFEAAPATITLTHRLFFELEAEQVNTLHFKYGAQRQSLIFTAKTPQHQIAITEASAAKFISAPPDKTPKP